MFSLAAAVYPGTAAQSATTKPGVVSEPFPLKPEVANLARACVTFLETGGVLDMRVHGYKKVTKKDFLKHVDPAVLKAGYTGPNLYQASVGMYKNGCSIDAAKVPQASSALQVAQDMTSEIEKQLSSLGYRAFTVAGAGNSSDKLWVKKGQGFTLRASLDPRRRSAAQVSFIKATPNAVAAATKR